MEWYAVRKMKNSIRRVAINTLVIFFSGSLTLAQEIEKESQEELQEVVNYVTGLISKGDSSLYLFETRAISYLNLGQFSDALVDLHYLLSNQDRNDYWWNLKGLCEAELNMQSEAIKSYLKAIQFNDTASDYYVNLGMSYEESGKNDSASYSYSSAMKLDSENVQAKINMANLMSSSSFNNFEKALGIWDSLIDMDSWNEDYYNDRGLVFLKLGNFKRALEGFETAISINSEVATFHYNAARANMELGLYDESMKGFSKAIQLDSLDWNIYLFRSQLFEKLNQFEKSQMDYKLYLKLKDGK